MVNVAAGLKLRPERLRCECDEAVHGADKVNPVCDPAGPVSGPCLEDGSWHFGSTGHIGENELFSFSFRQTYASPPIVVALPTDDGPNASDLRIRNVTATGFEIAQVEPFSEDGPHTNMTVSYVAVEPGVHQLPDGTRIEAGLLSTRRPGPEQQGFCSVWWYPLRPEALGKPRIYSRVFRRSGSHWRHPDDDQ